MFITLEGPEGSGKTSHIPAMAEAIRQAGYQVVVTREPGGTPVGEKIREVVLSPDTPELCDTTELMLFAAARAQHIDYQRQAELIVGNKRRFAETTP